MRISVAPHHGQPSKNDSLEGTLELHMEVAWSGRGLFVEAMRFDSIDFD